MKMKRRMTLCMAAILAVSAFAEEKKAEPKTVPVPVGTRIMVETIDMLDSSRQKAGHRFRAKLAGDLVVEGKVVAPGGSILYGILAEAKKSRRAAGRDASIGFFMKQVKLKKIAPIQVQYVLTAQDKLAHGRAVGINIDENPCPVGATQGNANKRLCCPFRAKETVVESETLDCVQG